MKWNDSFSFGYYTPGRSGALVTLNGATQGVNTATRLKTFQALSGQQFGLPSNFRPLVDSALLRRLLVAWTKYYVQQRERRKWRPLFRSLETAFHAGLIPSDGLPSRNDAGTRVGLWVSAFEILFHPGGTAHVNKRVVQTALQTVPWTARELPRTRYSVRYSGNTFRATVAEAIYDDLYYARNRFLHGQSVRAPDLHYRRSVRFAALLHAAPVLYNAALLAFLRGKIPGGPDQFALTAEYFAASRTGIDVVQDALLAVRAPMRP